MKKRTRVTHLPGVPLPPDNRPLVAPIYQVVKFTFDDVAETQKYFGGEREGYYYSRVSNPTLTQLEVALADLQERDACLLTGSGIAAISHHAVRAAQGRGSRRVLRGVVPADARVHPACPRSLWRVGHHARSDRLRVARADARDEADARRGFERPTNPVLKVADLERVTGLARAHGALTLLDNTLAGLHNHGQFDVDLYAHSLTKFASGHGDVYGRRHHRPARTHRCHARRLHAPGPTLDPHAAYLILRGLKTYFVRWDCQCRNAARVAEFLASHPAVSRVRYPGLRTDPGHALATRQMYSFGTMVTFDLAAGLEAGTRFAEALELFELTSSLGSTESLVVPPAMQQPRGFTAEQRAWSDIGPGTVRLSVGIEDPDDLVDDLRQALALL